MKNSQEARNNKQIVKEINVSATPESGARLGKGKTDGSAGKLAWKR